MFLGDSITQQRQYTRYVQQYVYVRYPQLDVRFYNAGWDGDTAVRAGERLERDVLALSPTVVMLAFGMNDGGYHALDQEVVAAFGEDLRELVQRLKEKRVRVVVLTPGCVDGDRRADLTEANYNIALGALARVAEAVAAEEGCTHVDLWRGMLAVQNAEKERDKRFTMIPDGVHPSAAGHLQMARLILAGLGAEPLDDIGFLDVKTGEADGLRLEPGDGGDLTLVTTKPLATPFWIESGSLGVARRGGFLDALGGQRLVVRELKEGSYDVSVAGAYLGTHTADELSAGVALAGTWSTDAKLVHDVVRRKEDHYHTLWRDLQVPLEGKPGLDAVLGPMRQAQEALHAMTVRQCRAVEGVRITVSPVPSGDNVAQGRPFTSSDEHPWWKGLTDGSWDETYRHTYSTGASDVFPKWVTIDLAGNRKIAAVRLGVPSFGSTHTVEVGVSKNGKKFTDVGACTFEQGAAGRRTIRFAPRFAKHVRLVFRNRHPTRVVYDPNILFLTEVEVYGP